MGPLSDRTPGHASRRNYILLSGGIDSASCVAFYLRLGQEVTGIFVDYRQPPRAQEEHSARAVAAHYRVPLEVIRCRGQERSYSGEIRGRNAFLVFAALLFAPIQSGVISLGIHVGTPYYDCSESFAADMERIVGGYTNGLVTLGLPFLTWSKWMIYQFAREAEVPVSLTWSCEVGPTTPCGQCLSCLDRETLHARSSD
jgi:7-cyano-7-deazaguanine synthase